MRGAVSGMRLSAPKAQSGRGPSTEPPLLGAWSSGYVGARLHARLRGSRLKKKQQSSIKGMRVIFLPVSCPPAAIIGCPGSPESPQS